MDTQVHQRIKPAIDAYIAAAGISVPADDRPPHHSFTPPTLPRLDLEAARVTPIVWATDSSVNPVDWKIRAGYMAQMMPVTFPAIPGVDAAGVVDEVGADVVP